MRALSIAAMMLCLANPVAAQDLPEMTEAQQAAFDNLRAIANHDTPDEVAIPFTACLVLDASLDELQALTAAGPGDDLNPMLDAILPREGFVTCYAAVAAEAQ